MTVAGDDETHSEQGQRAGPVGPGRKKIAAIVTTYPAASHADLIVSKFAAGFPTQGGLREPRVELVSMYMDQVHGSDVGLELARLHDITVYPSIRAALTLTPPSAGNWPTADDWDDGVLAVDGVIIIAEHGDYSVNERQRRLYPRRHFFEQVCGVFASSGRSVPIFNDKHLSYNWADAWWMYSRARELEAPFMAGSALPVTSRTPDLEHDLEAPIEQAVSVGFHHSYPAALDSYGFHGLEALQCMVERRGGGETGIAAVQCLEGEAVWRAGDEGAWSRELAEAGNDLVEPKQTGRMEDNCDSPTAFLLEYADGLRAATLMLPGHLRGFGYAARVGGRVVSTGFNRTEDRDEPFTYQGLNIEEMFLSGQPQYPAERTLLVTGALDALMESRHLGHVRVDTPHLNVAYRALETTPIRPRP